MTINNKITLLALCVFFSVACGKKAGSSPNLDDYGTYENGKYINTFFDLETDIPSHWYLFSKEERSKLIHHNSRMNSTSRLTTSILFIASQNDYGPVVDTTAFNPSIILLAEKLKKISEVRTASDYLLITRQSLQQGDDNKVFPLNGFSTKNTNGITFTRLRIFHKMSDADSVDFTQDYYAVLHKGFALTYILTYRTENQLQKLEQILHTAKIHIQ